MNNVIEIENLNFSYDRVPILHNVSLKMESGSVMGFLGPNGAGKTTTIKILLTLITSYSGTVRIFDQDICTHRKSILSRIGSLVESPSLYDHLTAEENLRIVCLMLNIDGRTIPKVLDTVGLLHTAKKRVSEYSMGMKQRLGLAMALINEPQLLILDEPTNGLDPEGIREMRDFMKKIVQERNISLLVSSHLLSEIEHIADSVCIIDQGRIKYRGDLNFSNVNPGLTMCLEVNDPGLAHQLLCKRYQVKTLKGGVLEIQAENLEQVAAINTLLVESGIAVHQFSQKRPTLEDTYFKILKME